MDRKYFDRLQARLDKEGRRIVFKYPPRKEMDSVLAVVRHALTKNLLGLPYTKMVDTGKIQQLGGYKRSLHDLYRLSKSYFPECTIYDVLDALRVLKPYYMHCWTHHKMMFTLSVPVEYTHKATRVRYGI